MRCLVFVMLALNFCLACSEAAPTPSTLIRGGFDQEEMDAAMAKARQDVDSFIAELSHPTGRSMP